MSLASVVSLLVYTVGIKCCGINKQEGTLHAGTCVLPLGDTTNKLLKHGVANLIKHTATHIVRIYPKGLGSMNYEPHQYWSSVAQLMAINWQTFGVYPFARRLYVC
jgi:phosphatidylinositol phospholipase C delta